MLVITLGDPYGIMVEILGKCWSQLESIRDRLGKIDREKTNPALCLVGSSFHFDEQYSNLFGPQRQEQVKSQFMVARVDDKLEFMSLDSSKIWFIDTDQAGDRKVSAAHLSEFERGKVALRSLLWLKKPWMNLLSKSKGHRLSVLTGPVDKHAMEVAGFSFPGQTEFFEDLWGEQAVMILAGPKLKVGLVTNHHALKEVPGLLTQELVVAKIRLFVKSLHRLGFSGHPKIAVTALNPHASDQGKFGTEEAQIINPAIKRAQALIPNCTLYGPLPADTAFYRGYEGDFDGVLAMYHDQGLGPLKTVHFDEAVNISGGLSHLRISPDHGPAQDLFLRHRASQKSLQICLEWAERYLTQSTDLD